MLRALLLPLEAPEASDGEEGADIFPQLEWSCEVRYSHATATLLPMLLPCCRHAAAMLLPRYCHAIAMYSHATATPRCVRRFGCPVHPHLAHHHHHHHHHHEAFMAKVLVMYYQHHTLLGERTGARSMEHAAGTVSASRGVWYLYRVWPLPSSCMPRVPGL